MIFSKLDKEVLITLIVVTIAFLLFGFFIYQYAFGSHVNVKNSTGGVQTEQK